MKFEIRKYVTPEIVTGTDVRFLATQYIQNYGCKRVLIVGDSTIQSLGYLDEVIKPLQKSRMDYALYTNIEPNPTEEEVMMGVDVFVNNECDSIIAIGGGSVLDCAKGIAIVSKNKGVIGDYEGVDKIKRPMAPMVCIPTTAGTAADISQFAIIRNKKRKTKYAIISKAIVPDVSLTDPEVTCSMDPFLTACTGLDALTHAFEALVSNASSSLTQVNALDSIEKIFRYLKRAYDDPQDMEARYNMSLASLEAGLAFSNASLGAVHALAHSVGGYYNLAHGECNALLLESVINYNYESSKELYDAVYHRISGKNPSGKSDVRENLITAIIDLKQKVGMLHSLKELGIQKTSFNELAAIAKNDPCLVTNPKKTSIDDLISIYEEAYK